MWSPLDQRVARHGSPLCGGQTSRLGVLQWWGQEIVGAPSRELRSSTDARGRRVFDQVLQADSSEEGRDHE